MPYDRSTGKFRAYTEDELKKIRPDWYPKSVPDIVRDTGALDYMSTPKPSDALIPRTATGMPDVKAMFPELRIGQFTPTPLSMPAPEPDYLSPRDRYPAEHFTTPYKPTPFAQQEFGSLPDAAASPMSAALNRIGGGRFAATQGPMMPTQSDDRMVNAPTAWERIKQAAGAFSQSVDQNMGVEYANKIAFGKDLPKLIDEYGRYVTEAKRWGAEPIGPEEFFKNMDTWTGGLSQSDVQRIEIEAGARRDALSPGLRDITKLAGSVAGQGAVLGPGMQLGGAVSRAAAASPLLKNAPAWIQKAVGGISGAATTGAAYQAPMEALEELAYPDRQTFVQHLDEVGKTAAYWGAYGAANQPAQKIMSSVGNKIPASASEFLTRQFPATTQISKSVIEGGLTGTMVGGGMFVGELAKTGDAAKAWNQMTGEAKNEMMENFAESILYGFMRRGAKIPGDVPHKDVIDEMFDHIYQGASSDLKAQIDNIISYAETQGYAKDAAINTFLDYYSQSKDGEIAIMNARNHVFSKQFENNFLEQQAKGEIPPDDAVVIPPGQSEPVMTAQDLMNQAAAAERSRAQQMIEALQGAGGAEAEARRQVDPAGVLEGFQATGYEAPPVGPVTHPAPVSGRVQGPTQPFSQGEHVRVDGQEGLFQVASDQQGKKRKVIGSDGKAVEVAPQSLRKFDGLKVGDKVAVSDRAGVFTIADLRDGKRIRIADQEGKIFHYAAGDLKPSFAAPVQPTAGPAAQEAAVDPAMETAQTETPPQLIKKPVKGSGKLHDFKEETTGAGFHRFVVPVDGGRVVISQKKAGDGPGYDRYNAYFQADGTKEQRLGKPVEDAIGFDIHLMGADEIRKALSGEDSTRDAENPEYTQWLGKHPAVIEQRKMVEFAAYTGEFNPTHTLRGEPVEVMTLRNGRPFVKFPAQDGKTYHSATTASWEDLQLIEDPEAEQMPDAIDGTQSTLEEEEISTTGDPAEVWKKMQDKLAMSGALSTKYKVKHLSQMKEFAAQHGIEWPPRYQQLLDKFSEDAANEQEAAKKAEKQREEQRKAEAESVQKVRQGFLDSAKEHDTYESFRQLHVDTRIPAQHRGSQSRDSYLRDIYAEAHGETSLVERNPLKGRIGETVTFESPNGNQLTGTLARIIDDKFVGVDVTGDNGKGTIPYQVDVDDISPAASDVPADDGHISAADDLDWVTQMEQEARGRLKDEEGATADAPAIEPTPANNVDVNVNENVDVNADKPAAETQYTTFETAVTGKPVKTKMYQGRGASLEEIYGPEAVEEGRAVPILGPGQYYADTKKDAGVYGKDVKEHTVTLQNPYVITAYGQWHSLMGKAGAQHLDTRGPLFYQESDKIPGATIKLQNYLIAQGHDGVVIRFNENEKGLRESFSHNQLVKFGGTEAKAETVEPPSNVNVDEKPNVADSRESDVTISAAQASGTNPELGGFQSSKVVIDQLLKTPAGKQIQKLIEQGKIDEGYKEYRAAIKSFKFTGPNYTFEKGQFKFDTGFTHGQHIGSYFNDWIQLVQVGPSLPPQTDLVPGEKVITMDMRDWGGGGGYAKSHTKVEGYVVARKDGILGLFTPHVGSVSWSTGDEVLERPEKVSSTPESTMDPDAAKDWAIQNATGVTKDVLDQVRELAGQGKKKEAIKAYKNALGIKDTSHFVKGQLLPDGAGFLKPDNKGVHINYWDETKTPAIEISYEDVVDRLVNVNVSVNVTAAPSANTVTVKTENGTAVDVQYRVVDASQLIASNHAETLASNPKFPKELQPRDRSRAASEEQIQRILANLEPAFLGDSPKASEGAPIVGPDHVVESGNGRVLALQRGYARNAAKMASYKQYLIDNAAKFGLAVAQIEGMTAPVLVRERTSEMTKDERIAFVQEANVQSVAAMSAMEQAKADAAKLQAGLISLFNPDAEGNIAAAGNREFVRGFMQAVVPASERGRYIDSEGALNQDGVRRITNAVFARVYGASPALERLAEALDNNVRNVTNGMLLAARGMLRLKDAIERGDAFDTLDLTGDITAAANKLSELRDRGDTVADYFNQASLFGDNLSVEAKNMLAIFDGSKRSVKRLADILSTYAQLSIDAGSPNQGALFGETKAPTKIDMLQATINKLEGESGEQITIWESESGSGQTHSGTEPAKGNRPQTPQDAADQPGSEVDETAPATTSIQTIQPRRADELNIGDTGMVVSGFYHPVRLESIETVSRGDKRYIFTDLISGEEIRVYSGADPVYPLHDFKLSGDRVENQDYHDIMQQVVDHILDSIPGLREEITNLPKNKAIGLFKKAIDGYGASGNGVFFGGHYNGGPDKQTELQVQLKHRYLSYNITNFRDLMNIYVHKTEPRPDRGIPVFKFDSQVQVGDRTGTYKGAPSDKIGLVDFGGTQPEKIPLGDIRQAGINMSGSTRSGLKWETQQEYEALKTKARFKPGDYVEYRGHIYYVSTVLNKGYPGELLTLHTQENVNQGTASDTGSVVFWDEVQKAENQGWSKPAKPTRQPESAVDPKLEQHRRNLLGILASVDSMRGDQLTKTLEKDYALTGTDKNETFMSLQADGLIQYVHNGKTGYLWYNITDRGRSALNISPAQQNDADVNAADDLDWVDDLEAQARERIRAEDETAAAGESSGKGGIPPHRIMNFALIGFSKLVKNRGMTYDQWAKAMTDEFGPGLRLYLGGIYGQSMSMLSMTREEVRQIISESQQDAMAAVPTPTPAPAPKPQPPAPPKEDSQTPAPKEEPQADPSSWRSQEWAKDARKSHELANTLDTLQTDEKRMPTVADAVSEAQYVLRTFNDGGHANNDDLTGANGNDAAKRARSETKAIEAFIRKYEAEAETNANMDQPADSGERSGGTGSNRADSNVRGGKSRGGSAGGGGGGGRSGAAKSGDSGRSNGGRRDESGDNAGARNNSDNAATERTADVVEPGDANVQDGVSPGAGGRGFIPDTADGNEDYESRERVGVDVPSFVEYVSQRITGTAHRGDVVEPFGLSLVAYPEEAFSDEKYAPHAIVKKGGEEKLSDLQLETVSLAKYNFDNGKRGMLIADDTGVGKTAEQVAIAADAFHSGKVKRILIVTKGDQVADGFLTENEKFNLQLPLTLVNSQSHDNFKDDHKLNLPKTAEKLNAMDPKKRRAFEERISKNPYKSLNISDGAIVMSQYTFRDSTYAVQEWLKAAGGDVIVMFDESHVMKNIEGGAQVAMAAKNLFETFADRGQFIYSSATAAEDIAGMEHLYGLKLWAPDGFNWFRGGLQGVQSALSQGKGSPFEREIPLLVMEQVVRELKMRGQYVGRALSMDGITMEGLPVELTEEDLDEWGSASEFVLHVAEQAEQFGKRAAQTAFFVGYMRRLRGYYVMKGVIRWMKENSKNGKPPRVALSGFFKSGEDEETGENAMLEAAIRQIKSKKTPIAAEEVRDALLNMLHGGEGGQRPVPFLPSPMDMLAEAFGSNNVAVISGDQNTTERMNSVKEFQGGKKSIIYFTQAGNTGINLHDTIGQQITFIPIDYPWEAKEQKQSEGRVNRTGQKTKPRFLYPFTPAAVDKKFVGTLKARYESMGALSRGQSIDLGGDAFGDFDFSGPVAKNAVYHVVPLLTSEQLAAMFGQAASDLFNTDEESSTEGGVLDFNRHVYTLFRSGDPVKKFLNALMLLDVPTGNEVFEQFVESFQLVKTEMDLEGGVNSVFETFFGEQQASAKGEGGVTVRKIKTRLTNDQRKAIQTNLQTARKQLNAAVDAVANAKATAVTKLTEQLARDRVKQTDLRRKYAEAKMQQEQSGTAVELAKRTKRRKKIGEQLGKLNEKIDTNERLLFQIRAGGSKAEEAYKEVSSVKKAESAHNYATFRLMEAEAQAEANDRVMMLDGPVLTAGKMVPIKAAIRKAAKAKYGGDESKIPPAALRVEIRGYMLTDDSRVVGVVVPAWAEDAVLEALKVQQVQGLTNKDTTQPTRALKAARNKKTARLIKRLQDTTRVLTPKTAHTVADILANGLDTVVYQGRVASGAEGVYDHLKSKAIAVRARSGDNWRTVGHELAHAFVEMNAIVGDTAELKALADGLYPNPLAIPKQLHEEEGFAEFFRLWVVDPYLARQYAPKTTTMWEDHVANDPILEPLFAKIRLLVDNEFVDTATGRVVAGSISSEYRGDRTVTTQGPEYKMTGKQRLLFQLADFTIPAKHLDDAFAKATKRPDLSLRRLMSVMGDNRAKALLTFQSTPTNHKGKRYNGPILQDLYENGVRAVIEFMGNKKINLASKQMKELGGSRTDRLLTTIGLKDESDVDPLYDKYRKMGAKDAFDALLLALRVRERYATGKYEDGKLPLTKEHAQQVIDEAKQNYPDAIKAARELTKRFSDIVLQLLVDADVITPKTANDVKAGSDWYIPFYYVDAKAKVTVGSDESGRTNKQPVKRFFGQNKPTIDGFQAMMLKLMEVHQSIEYKRVMNLLHEMADNDEGVAKHFMRILPAKMEVVQIASDRIADEIFKHTQIDLSQALQNINQFKFFMPDRQLDEHRRTILNVRNGKAVEIELAKDLFDSVMAMKPVQVQGLGKVMRHLTRIQRFVGLVTARYVSSAITRDAGAVLVQSERPQKTFAQFFNSLAAIFGIGKGDKMYESFVNSGAASGALENMLRNIGSNHFGDDILNIPAAGWGKVTVGTKKMWTRVVKSPSELMRVVEEGPRIAEYIATWKQEVKEMGLDPEKMWQDYLDGGTDALPQKLQDAMERILVDAAYAAREVTTNFGLHGASDFVRKYIPTVPFLQGSVQGFYRFMRQLRAHPVRTPVVAATSFGLMSVMSWAVMNGLLNLLGDDDDEIARRKQDYHDMNSPLKDKYWWFPVHPGITIAWGKPFEYAIPANMLERLLEHAGDEPGAREWYSDMKSLLSTMTNLDVINNVVNIYSDLKSNTTVFGGSIVPMGEANDAENLRYAPDTSMTTRYIANWITDVTNSPKGGPSPREMDYFVKSLLGRYGTGALNTLDFAWALMRGENLPSAVRETRPVSGIAHMPVIGQILYDRSEQGGSRLVNKFYRDLDMATDYSASAKKLFDQGNRKLPGWVTENGLNLLRALPMLNEVSNQLSDMNEQYKTVIGDTDKKPSQRERYRLQQNYWREMLAGVPYGRPPMPPDPKTGITEAQTAEMYATVLASIDLKVAREAKTNKGATEQWQYLMYLKNGE